MIRPKKETVYLKDFGKRLVALRRSAGMTQEELAIKSGLSAETISSLERGVRFTRLSYLHSISAALGLEIDDLFKGLKHKR